MPKTQHHPTSPRLYSLDFFDARNIMDPFGMGYIELRRERFERMLIAHDIPPIWAMLLLYSSWPPERLRAHAMSIIAQSLPPKVAGLGAETAAEDMSARNQQSKSALYRHLLLEGTFFALEDLIDEAKRRKTLLIEAVAFYNASLRQTPLLALEAMPQRRQIVHEAQKRHPTLDSATLDWVLHEVAVAVRRNPRLAGLPVEVSADYMGEPDGPKWEPYGTLIGCHDLASSPPYDVPLLEWANRCAQDLIRSIYKHARRNLLGWGYRQPRVKLPCDEIEVTAQRRHGPSVQGHKRVKSRHRFYTSLTRRHSMPTLTCYRRPCSWSIPLLSGTSCRCSLRAFRQPKSPKP